jgi:hypothetical protein
VRRERVEPLPRDSGTVRFTGKWRPRSAGPHRKNRLSFQGYHGVIDVTNESVDGGKVDRGCEGIPLRGGNFEALFDIDGLERRRNGLASQLRFNYAVAIRRSNQPRPSRRALYFSVAVALPVRLLIPYIGQQFCRLLQLSPFVRVDQCRRESKCPASGQNEVHLNTSKTAEYGALSNARDFIAIFKLKARTVSRQYLLLMIHAGTDD